ncbi:hypothetical protein RND81_12G033900 [Saponaria officinalis]|uniref:Reverse transcriptase zinc-binding domain-containing protein n=1 Tax=Saponaria officinalis TaxID=3572 RepID=A0AAW1H2R2_SAPOF
MEVQCQILHLTGFSEGFLPFTYLGLPLSSSRLKRVQYSPLIDKLVNQTLHWSSSFLSHAGKIQLISSVLFSNLVYWPRLEGGLGIKEILSWNKALMLKWLWRLEVGIPSLWAKWVGAYLLKRDSIWSVSARQIDHWLWKGLLEIRDDLVSKVGSPDQAAALIASWCRCTDGAPRFCVQQAYHCLRPRGVRLLKLRGLWEPWAFPKHCVVGWTAYHKRLATIDMLQRHGFSFVNRSYLCRNACESHEHLFFKCSYMGELWRIVMLGIGITRRPRSFAWELEWIYRNVMGKDPPSRLYRMAIVGVMYHGWIERNNRVFRGIEREANTVCRQINFELACRFYKFCDVNSFF